MVKFEINGICFSHRVGGIARQNGKVMLNKSKTDPYWFIPGGRIEEGEDSTSAIIREMQEEIGQQISILKPICTIENYFVENGKKYHEVGIYYSILVPKIWEGIIEVQEGNSILEYKWFDIENIEEIKLYPTIIKGIILERENGHHYIHNQYE